MRELAPALASLHREVRPLGGQLVLVYIAEAHATDQWPINSARCRGPGNSVVAPTTLDERAAIARRMVAALELGDVPILADGMDDAFLRAYAAWPVRLYGVGRDGRLGVVAQPQHGQFELPPLRDWLLAECAASREAAEEEAVGR